MRKRPRYALHEEEYADKVVCLHDQEYLAERGVIDLFYGDEANVSEQTAVPYAWQFPDEKQTAFMPTTHGASLCCFALISRDNRSHWANNRTAY